MVCKTVLLRPADQNLDFYKKTFQDGGSIILNKYEFQFPPSKQNGTGRTCQDYRIIVGHQFHLFSAPNI